MLSHLDLLDESHTKIRNALRSPEFSSSSGNLVASRHHGQLKNSTPATSSATTMGKRSPMSTTRKSQGGDQHVMKARCRCLTQMLSVELGAPSCANGEPNRDKLLEARHQLRTERHYADTR